MRKSPNEPRSRPVDRSPHRRCILTGAELLQADMVRLALGPDDCIAVDVRSRAPGRGAWISVDRDELARALQNGQLKSALSRAFRTGKLEIPDDLPILVEQALQQATLDRLGLEARGGMLLTGAEKVETAARLGQIALLLHAGDAGRDGRAKLDQAWRVGMDREGEDVRGTILPVDREPLSVALGRQNAVHIGLIDRKAADRVLLHLDRWRRFVGDDGEGDHHHDRKVA